MNTPFIHTPQCCQPSSQTCGLPAAQAGGTGIGGAHAGGSPVLKHSRAGTTRNAA